MQHAGATYGAGGQAAARMVANVAGMPRLRNEIVSDAIVFGDNAKKVHWKVRQEGGIRRADAVNSITRALPDGTGHNGVVRWFATGRDTKNTDGVRG